MAETAKNECRICGTISRIVARKNPIVAKEPFISGPFRIEVMEPLRETFSGEVEVELPGRPYLALRVRRVD